MTYHILPRAIFFDWDGTLVDSYSFLHSAHSHTHAHFNMGAFSLEAFKIYFGKQRDEIFKGIYGKKHEEARMCFDAFVQEHHVTNINPMSGAKELLDYIQESGIISGIVSNKKSSFIKDEIAYFGWDKYFSSIIGSGDASKDKPAADPLLFALSQVGVEAHQKDIWYVGDTQTDIDCAQNSACASIFIQQEQEILENTYPFLIVENCLGLHEFLLQCVKK
ncbi:MAG: HAD family hydrolase [Alphaproteobacteria bacterium]|nr:HAD family hydrolase [Alphaproteobacteria bacterium]